MNPPRYSTRLDCVLDSYGGAQSFRVVPIMGQGPAETWAFAEAVAAALNATGGAAQRCRRCGCGSWNESNMGGIPECAHCGELAPIQATIAHGPLPEAQPEPEPDCSQHQSWRGWWHKLPQQCPKCNGWPKKESPE